MRFRSARCWLRRRYYAWTMRRWVPRVDAFGVGYPKTGSTWLQVMLWRLIARTAGLDAAAPEAVLLMRLRRSARPRLPAGAPLLHFTHHMPNFHLAPAARMRLDLEVFRGRRVVLLARDPKDVLTSLHRHMCYRENPPTFAGSLEDLVRDRRVGLERYLRFYEAWEGGRALPRVFCLVRYEDLKTRPLAALRRVAGAIGLEPGEADLADAVRFGSFANMRRLEDENRAGALLAAGSGKRGDARHVRRGEIGGHRGALSPETAAFIDERARLRLPPFLGYPYGAEGG